MKIKYIYISLFSLFISLNTLGQEKQLKKADKYYSKLAYINAREAYINVIESGYESQEIYQKIADSYYFNADLAKASAWYGKLYEKYQGNIEPEYLFRYSQSLKNVKEYEKSDQIMSDFDSKIGRTQKRAQLFKEEPDYLKLIELQSGRFKIKNLKNINTEGADFGPSFYKDEAIVFASSRRSNLSKVVHEWSGQNFLDLFSSSRINRQTEAVEEAINFDKKINTKLHESSTIFTSDGNTMYFTRNNFTSNKIKSDDKGTTLLKIYKSVKNTDTGKWEKAKELPFNSDQYSVAHPALSPDETKLYFASDMPGTKGLSDLFYVDILEDDDFGSPRSLGDEINTEGRETFPFISNSGKLFFASDGHVGLGGLDIFVSLPNEIKVSKNKYKEPFNIGEPVNTPDDDFAFIIDDQTRIGYFSSNRKGGIGNDDIYSFKQTKDLIISCSQTLSGVITDRETRELLPNAVVTLFNKDMQKIATTTTDENAFYELPIECNLEYVIRAQKDTYEATEVDFVTNNDFDFAHNQPIQLAKGAPVLNNVEAKIGDDLAKLLQLKPIYFDLDKSFIRPDAEIELQKIIAVMKEYPNLEIDVRSHTDSRSSFDYNIDLSTRRVNSTIAYISEKGGIAKYRLTGRGYGEIELQNRCKDGVPCTEEQHQLNRRSEFIITKQ